MNRRVLMLAEDEAGRAMLAHTQEMLARFGVAHDLRIVSAVDSASLDADVIIAANTVVATLSARVAAITARPVLAVPVGGSEMLSASADGSGALCLAIGKAGAINAALLAVAILANEDEQLRAKLMEFRREQTAAVLADKLE